MKKPRLRKYCDKCQFLFDFPHIGCYLDQKTKSITIKHEIKENMPIRHIRIVPVSLQKCKEARLKKYHDK